MENEPGRSPAASSSSSKRNDLPDRSERLGRSVSSSSDTSSDGMDPGRDGSDLHPRRRRNYIEDEIPVSSTPGTTTGDIPPVQVMERTSQSGSPGTYKFPSSVFARAKSTSPNPMEWSTASNESLFSIHMGDTSFNKEMYWLGRSGELGMSGDPITPTANHSPNNERIPRKAELNNEEIRRVNDRPVTTRLQMGSDSRDKESVRSPWECLNLSASPSSHHSDASGASVRSFAFPILTGDDRGSSKKSAQGSTKPLTHFENTQQEPPQTPRQDSPNQKPPVETQQGGGWFSCLGGCRWCSCRYCS